MNVNAPSDIALEAATSPATTLDIESLFRARFDRVARVIARVVRDPARAEELAVEAFVRLWRTPRA
jgi:RNA polymerase sigma-70 factor (ECF subfamily)